MYNKIFRGALAATVALVLSMGSASAALVKISGPNPGNDDASSVSALVNKTVTNLGRINITNNGTDMDPDYAIDTNDIDNGIFDTDQDFLNAFSFTINNDDGDDGTVNFDLTGTGFGLTHVVLKAGNDNGGTGGFTIFEWDGNAFTGSFQWSTLAAMLVNQNNNSIARVLSHISFYGMDMDEPPEVPIPGAIWLMMAGLAGLRVASRRKKAA